MFSLWYCTAFIETRSQNSIIVNVYLSAPRAPQHSPLLLQPRLAADETSSNCLLAYYIYPTLGKAISMRYKVHSEGH